MANKEKCPICNKKVSHFMYKIQCIFCLNIFHKNCTLLNDAEFKELSKTQQNIWSCRICNEDLFVFNQIEDNDIFHRCLLELNLDNTVPAVVHYQDLIFQPFELNEDKDDIPLSDLDPDLAFYNTYHHILYNNCDYFDENSFNKAVVNNFNQRNTFSFFHLNIRSMPANLTNMLCYMANLDLEFDIIGITENWLTKDNKDLYFIDNYDHISNIRTDRAGGGVSLFIASHIKYKQLTEFCIINDHLECIFIEAEIKSSFNIIGIVYRPPNSDMNAFTSLFNDILEKLKISNRKSWIMGDFNIDLMKNTSHRPTNDFLNMLFSNSLMPLINKPTRITTHSATLIDNIFSNSHDTEGKILQGNLTTSISDHFAQFHIIEIPEKSNSDDEYMLIRSKTQNNVEKFCNFIQNFDWSSVENFPNCNEAYQYFSDTLKRFYNKSFPVRKIKKKYRNRLPWLTDGLRKSIKHKNKLYRKYLKFQTSYNRKLYSVYNNKLKSILKKN